MPTFVLTRILTMAPVVLLVTFFVFALSNAVPGDPILQMIPPEEAQRLTLEDLQEIRAQYGLDQPMLVQYASWLGRLATGDLGRSLRTRRPVLQSIVDRIPVTAQLASMAMLIALSGGIPLGIWAALRPRSFSDTAASVIALLGVSMPNIFLGALLIYLFAYTLQWLPAGGYVPLASDAAASVRSMLLPAFTLGTALMGSIMRITRTSMLEVLGLDYIATARGKGLSARSVIYRHALKNAFIPVLTVIGLQTGALLGGSFIVEQIFSIPGVGRLAVGSIFARDFPVVQGVVMLFALTYLVINLVVDLLYGWLDPRIRIC